MLIDVNLGKEIGERLRAEFIARKAKATECVAKRVLVRIKDGPVQHTEILSMSPNGDYVSVGTPNYYPPTTGVFPGFSEWHHVSDVEILDVFQ
jgi:hypothetical protein